MKHLIIAAACVLFAVFTLPLLLPATGHHAFAAGDINVKWCHIVALGLVVLVFKGGK